jgi:hypothetical protein
MAKSVAPAIKDHVKRVNQTSNFKEPLPTLRSLKSDFKDTGPAYYERNIYVPRGNFKMDGPLFSNSWSNEYTSKMLPPTPPPEPNFRKIKLFNGRAKKTVQKQKPGFHKQPNVRNYAPDLSIGPRDLLFHEAGHAMHEIDDPRIFGLLRKQDSSSYFPNPQTTLAKERIANNNAINFMRQNNVPNRNIENYIHNTDNAYGGYMGSVDPQFRKTNTYSPGHSVQTH